MKVSLNWVKEFTDVQLAPKDLVEKIGSELGAVEEVIELGGRYQHAVIVKVVSCVKHPDADKLSVCLIDDAGAVENIERNEQGQVQIVCGAPNVKADMLAVWLPPGAVVPSSVDKDPFTLEAREIRGQKSNGMLASAKELAIGDSHEGLLVVDEDVAPGASFAEVYGLNDYVIDIENKMFTHRPDCFGILGVAREIAGISGQAFASPRWYSQLDGEAFVSQSDKLVDFKVENHASSVVPRLMAVAMSDVSVRPSPLWLQTKLSRLGVRPINNIVDMTNYIMLLSGQPIHAYDFDKVKALSGGKATLTARLSQTGEKLALLNGKEITLEEGAVVIATDQKAIGLGGVMGGAETEVDDNTKNIIIECATFDMNLTRKTAMRYGLFTDAVTRYTKGQSPLQNPYVLQKAAEMATELSGAKVSGAPWDAASDYDQNNKQLSVSTAFVNSRLGLEMGGDQMKHLLENVEFKVELSGNDLHITAPFWRMDIEIAEDIVEEIGRLHGYDKLPLDLPKRSIKPAGHDPKFAFKASLRNILSAAGANEVLTYSFVDGKLLERAGQDKEKSYHLKNALSPSLQYYRQSLTPSLLDKIHPNIKAGFDSFAVYEIGKGHLKGVLDDGQLPKEFNLLSLVFAASSKDINPGAAYYTARKYLDYLADKLNLLLEYKSVDQSLDIHFAKPYEPGRSALVSVRGGHMLGIIGEFNQAALSGFKLPAKTAGFEISLDDLMIAAGQRTYQPLDKYPETVQDICLKVEFKTPYDAVEQLLGAKLKEASDLDGYKYGLSPIDIFQKDDDQDHKQITWRVRLWHLERTLTTEEVNKVFDMLEVAAKDKFNAERI